MNEVVRGAVNICTGVYISVGIFGYIALNQVDFGGNILTAYPPSVIIQVIKIGFGISVAMSFPLVVFPCRTAIHSLMFRKTGYTAASSDMLGANYIPPKRFNLITIIVIGVTLGTFLPASS
jgi:sodium-coupled neutral amino acid transporter 10